MNLALIILESHVSTESDSFYVDGHYSLSVSGMFGGATVHLQRAVDDVEYNDVQVFSTEKQVNGYDPVGNRYKIKIDGADAGTSLVVKVKIHVNRLGGL